MKRIWIALLLVGACGSGSTVDNGSSPAESPAIDTSRLLGLYQSGPQGQRNQLCMIGDAPDAAAFGLTVWGANLASCSGSGKAVRQENVLRLEMAGDQPCTVEARIESGKVTLPDTVPESCAYYCGNAATLARATFDKTGSTRADALKATDLVGEPLCAGLKP